MQTNKMIVHCSPRCIQAFFAYVQKEKTKNLVQTPEVPSDFLFLLELGMIPLHPPHPNQNPMQTYAPTALDRSRGHCRRRTAGFTLVELLVVIAIIAVLAALAFPTLSKMSAGSSLTKAVSNFRGLGGVIMTYAADNNQSLPLFQTNHRWGYRSSSPNQIGSVLYQQMGLPAPTKVFQPVPLLTVPALKKWLSKYSPSDSYGGAHSVVCEITMADGIPKYPFGSPSKQPTPLKIHQIPNPSKTWAVYELGGTGDPNPALKINTYPEPIHGDKRTVLFFDGHVEVVPSSAPKPIY